ncbi:MAG: hypothetical protein ACRDP1_11525 [Nocardioidaceae bacterium]
MSEDRFRRPALPGAALFESLPGRDDPAKRAEAGTRVARLLVRGAHDADDAEVTQRIVTLADEHGLELLADLWSGAPADSLAGALWRLYLLRASVHSDPGRSAAEYAAGRSLAPVLEVVAGVIDPPGPVEVVEMVDLTLRGVACGDLATTFDRAAAFAKILAIGRARSGDDDTATTVAARRLADTADQLELAARAEREHRLV